MAAPGFEEEPQDEAAATASESNIPPSSPPTLSSPPILSSLNSPPAMASSSTPATPVARVVQAGALAWLTYKTVELAVDVPALLVQPALVLLKAHHHKNRADGAQRIDAFLYHDAFTKAIVRSNGAQHLHFALLHAQDVKTTLHLLSIMNRVAKLQEGARQLENCGIHSTIHSICDNRAPGNESCKSLVTTLVNSMCK